MVKKIICLYSEEDFMTCFSIYLLLMIDIHMMFDISHIQAVYHTFLVVVFF